jgi:hypothetical protein
MPQRTDTGRKRTSQAPYKCANRINVAPQAGKNHLKNSTCAGNGSTVLCWRFNALRKEIIMKSEPQAARATFSHNSIRWPTDLKAELQRRASAEHRKLSNYVIHTLREHVEATQPKHAVDAGRF